MNRDKRTHNCDIVVNQTQSSPAVKMLFLQVFGLLEEPDQKPIRKTYPVLAIRTEYVQCFCRSSPPDSYFIGEPTAEILMDSGWSFRGNEVRIHAVILDEEYGLIDADDPLMSQCDEVSQLIDTDDKGVVESTFSGLEHELERKLKKKSP